MGGLPSLQSLLPSGTAGPFANQLQAGTGFSLRWGATGGSPARSTDRALGAHLARSGTVSAPMAALEVTEDSGWRTPQGALRGQAERLITAADPATGLTLEITYLRHGDGASRDTASRDTPSRRGAGASGAVSWRGWIVNRGTAPVTHVTRVAMLDVEIHLDGQAAGNPTVRSMRGGVNDAFFPPEAFSVSERTLFEIYRPAAVELDSGGTGRSTDKDAPYVVVSSGDDSGGCFAALGWSALWQLTVTRRGSSLRLEGVVDGVDLTLEPGERVPLPEALLGFYAGALQDGANALRRVLRRDFAPYLNGKPVTPPVQYDNWFEFRLGLHEDILKPQLAPCAALGVEYFVVDSGWFAGSETSYVHGCGNWKHEAKERFPSGIRAFADQVRAHGMRFGIWIDPEIVHPESETGREHPEWLLEAEGSRDGTAVVDFSQQAARDWAVDTIADIVERYQVEWLRWDVNMAIAPNWAANDPPDKRGWHQMQHVAGVHEILDRVQARYPNLLFEGCCGGGRRVDLGLLRRSHTFWCSDMTGPAPIVRAHQSGGNRLLPAGSFNTNFLYGPANPAEPAAQPASRWLSHFGGPLGFSGDFRSWTPEQLAAGWKYVDAFKRWRHVLAGDFYPLFPMPRSLAEWDGWQFDDPERGEGLIIAFREQSPNAEVTVKLGGSAVNGVAAGGATSNASASAGGGATAKGASPTSSALNVKSLVTGEPVTSDLNVASGAVTLNAGVRNAVAWSYSRR